MKNTIKLFFLSMLCLLFFQSCENNDEVAPLFFNKVIIIEPSNAGISYILIKSGEEVIFESSETREGFYYELSGNLKQVYIEARAITQNAGKSSIRFKELVGGDCIFTRNEIEVDALIGQEIKLSGIIDFEGPI